MYYEVGYSHESGIRLSIMITNIVGSKISDERVRFDRNSQEDAENFIGSMIVRLNQESEIKSNNEIEDIERLFLKYFRSVEIHDKVAVLENLINKFFYSSSGYLKRPILVSPISHLFPLIIFVEYILYYGNPDELKELSKRNRIVYFIEFNLKIRIQQDLDGKPIFIDLSNVDLSIEQGSKIDDDDCSDENKNEEVSSSVDSLPNFRRYLYVDRSGKFSIDRFLILVKIYGHQIFDKIIILDEDPDPEGFFKEIILDLIITDGLGLENQIRARELLIIKYLKTIPIKDKVTHLENVITGLCYVLGTFLELPVPITPSCLLIFLAKQIVNNLSQKELKQLARRERVVNFIKTNLQYGIHENSDGKLCIVDLLHHQSRMPSDYPDKHKTGDRYIGNTKSLGIFHRTLPKCSIAGSRAHDEILSDPLEYLPLFPQLT